MNRQRSKYLMGESTVKLWILVQSKEPHSVALPQPKAPPVSPLAKGGHGGCKKTFPNLSTWKWGKKVFTREYHKVNPSLSIKGRLLIFALCISLIPITTITTIYYFHSRGTLKSEIIEKLKAVAESREPHIQSTLEKLKVRTVDFSSDGFIRNSFERIVRGRDSKQDAVIRLNAYLKKNKLTLYSHGLPAIILVDKVGKVISSTDEKLVGKDFSG